MKNNLFSNYVVMKFFRGDRPLLIERKKNWYGNIEEKKYENDV